MLLDVAIVGGGVVGQAIAASLSCSVNELLLMEQCAHFGMHQSSHNSEVIHAGIYYEPHSLKARLCVEGRRRLYEIASKYGIPHRKCGKLIVAWSSEQLPELYRRFNMGIANGVQELRIVEGHEIQALQPHINAIAAIHSPQTGIIDSHALMAHYRRVAEGHDASLVLNSTVTSLTRQGHIWLVGYRDSSGEGVIEARAVVNAAGLGAQAVMKMAGIDPERHNLTLHLSKGEYFSVFGPSRTMLDMLVYPIPDSNLTSLGIHSLIDLGGGLKLGPSVIHDSEIDYSVNPANAGKFYESVRDFLPFLSQNELQPDMAGIRAKLSGRGEPARDFHIAHENKLNAPGFFNLVGIDSPGLTSSLAIGEYVSKMVLDYLR